MPIAVTDEPTTQVRHDPLVELVREHVAPDERRSDASTDLVVEREGINFYNLTPQVLRIEITVWNHGAETSQRAPMRIDWAPLGAFVDWKPLTAVDVPPIAPGQSSVVTTDVPTPPHTQTDGPFERVTDGGDVLAGDGASNPPSRIDTFSRRIMTILRSGRDPRGQNRSDRPSVYWAGNLNVFIGGRDVERHMTQALRVYPACTNLAQFFVGTGSDEYSFSLSGSGLEWEPSLAMDFRAVLQGPLVSEVPLDQWVPLKRRTPIILAMQPPADATTGDLQVHVKQHSTGKATMVEFSLDATAAGPGCYTV